MGRIKWFDAIRALGLFLVLGYHLFYNAFPGGFLGVDIFFTFSGYLITALIVERMQSKESFGVLSFYKRRFIRIFPPLFLSVVFTLPFLLLISPDFSTGIAKQAAAAVGFATNWFEITTGGSYEGQLIPHLYVHTWSLAVEMHFYLIWGFVCALAAALTKRLTNKNDVKKFSYFKFTIFIVSLALAAFSFIYMQILYNTGVGASFIYFNTFTRLFPFFLGSAAAALWGVQHEPEKHMDPHNLHIITSALILFAALAALAIVVFSVNFNFTDDFIYQYGFLLTSLLTVALIYGTHSLHILTPYIKQPAALKITADLSYDIYLYHWPVYIIASALIVNNFLASVVTLVVSVVLSALMLYGVERIFKPIKKPGEIKTRRLAFALTFAAVLAASSVNARVINNAPYITSIESDFAVSYIYQDIDGLKSLKPNLPEVATEPVTEPITEPVTEPATEPVTEPITEPITEPVTEPITEPITEPVTEPITEPITEPVTEPVTEPPQSIAGGVTVIGDSVALGAQLTLTRTIPDCYVDAKVSRSINAGYGIMAELINNGKLGEYVVIALGTNGHNNYASLLTQFIENLPAGRKLIFVTPFDGRSNENSKTINSTAAWLRELPGQYDFVTIADWSALIGSQVGLLAGDKVHMGGQTSMSLYTGCIVEAIEAASQKPAKS